MRKASERRKAIAVAGGGSNLALLSSGKVVTWGGNRFGQLGDGKPREEQESSSVPVEVCAENEPEGCQNHLSDATAIAAGNNFGLAVRQGGQVIAWGNNESGQLGDGSTGGTKDTPVEVSGLASEGVSALSAGTTFALALTKHGTVKSWGSNSVGQLGIGKTKEQLELSNVPVPVESLMEVSAISAHGVDALALRTGGTADAWGENAYGQFGNGTTEGSDKPIAVPAPTEVAGVAAGSKFSTLLMRNGKAFNAGKNSEGQLGDGSTTGPETCEVESSTFACSRARVEVEETSPSAAVAGGESHALALLADDTVIAWGSNESGQLGDARTASEQRYSSVPVLVCTVAELLCQPEHGLRQRGVRRGGFTIQPGAAQERQGLGVGLERLRAAGCWQDSHNYPRATCPSKSRASNT